MFHRIIPPFICRDFFPEKNSVLRFVFVIEIETRFVIEIPNSTLSKLNKKCEKKLNFVAMKILIECKRLLSYGGMGAEQYVDIGGKRVPRIMTRLIIMSGVMLLAIFYSINIYNSPDLDTMLFHVHLAMLHYHKWAVYCVLLWKTEQIAQLIDYLRTVVKRRKFFFFFLKKFFSFIVV